jgi:hypothetical protein
MGVPCGWVVDGCECGGTWTDFPAPAQAAAEALAATVLWAATGRRYGLCEITVLPCNPAPVDPLYQTFPVSSYDPLGLGGGVSMTPVLAGGDWHNLTCGGRCSCKADCEVALDGPVADVVDVLIDGVSVPATAYEVHDRFLLVRTDGDCWPTCQVFGQEIPGFEVTYLRGDPIPDHIQHALNVLGCEYAKACVGRPCGLPSRMTRLTRQGVEVTIADIPKDGKGRIRTGLRLVDDAIDADNPFNITERPTVFSPDLPTPRVVTWRGGS